MKISIPNVTARKIASSSEPIFRWGAAPRLRAVGIRAFDLYASGHPFTSEDMKKRGMDIDPPHDEHERPILHRGNPRKGDRPMSEGEAAKAAEILNKLAAQVIAGTATPPTQSKGRTIEHLVEAFFYSYKTQEKYGTARPPVMKPDTARSYKSWSPPVVMIVGKLHPSALTKEHVIEMYEAVKEVSGERMAYGAVQLLSRVFSWAPTSLYGKLVWQRPGISAPAGKIRVASEHEISTLMQAAEDPQTLARILRQQGKLPHGYKAPPARIEVADAIMIAVWTTMRPRDIVNLTPEQVQDGRITKILSKSEKAKGGKRRRVRVDLPQKGPLPDRIQSILRRREEAQADWDTLLIGRDTHGRPAKLRQATLGRYFREARELAAFAAPLINGGYDNRNIEVEHLEFRDFRDTAFTRLLLANCTLHEISTWTGQKPTSIVTLMQNYAESDPVFADRAGDKIDKWWREAGLAA